MSGIAHRYGVTVAEIMALNNISNQNKIIVGQKLAIPGKISESKSVKKSTSSKHKSTPVPAGGSVYVVQSGDCLSVIAHKAGVSVQSIRDANSLKNDVIFVGKKLVIPGGKTIPVKKKPRVVSTPRVKKPVKTVVEDSPIPPADVAPVIKDADFPLPNLAPELPESSGTVQHHIVKPGQTILDVVSEFNVSIADLRKANNLSSDLLTPGQKLIIPTTE
jgi:LysM repeat protein